MFQLVMSVHTLSNVMMRCFALPSQIAVDFLHLYIHYSASALLASIWLNA